ncbi:hypothetical protein ACFQ0M_37030 [Kitasatospora aburaviensis]
MAETTAVPGGPDPVADAVPRDAVPPGPRNPYDEHLPGPAALYDPPTPPPAVPPAAPPMPPTGWTVTGMPAVDLPPSATPPPFTVPGATPAHGISAAPGAGPGGLGTAPRGRILVVEGGYGTSGRRTWGRGGPTQAPVLSAMLAAVSPQVLLAADAVDAVHLPGASDPHTVLAHLRAAARHPGPLLVHLGGHLLADKRGGQLHLTLRDSKPGSVRQDGLAWQSIAGELRHRPAEWQTLVIADLSADQNALPFLQGTISPLADGLPLWAVVSPDPEQIGTFTRALIEALHGGRPGAEAVLAPEQLRHQVYSVLRPDVVILATHAPNRPFFRNTARRTDGSQLDPVPYEGPRPAAVLPRPPAARDAAPRDAVPRDGVPADRPAVTLDKPAAAGVTGGAAPVPAAPPVPPTAPAPVPAPVAAPAPAPVVPEGPVDLLKAAVPATPPPPAQPVDLVKPYAWRPTLTDGIRLGKPAPADAVPQDAAPRMRCRPTRCRRTPFRRTRSRPTRCRRMPVATMRRPFRRLPQRRPPRRRSPPRRALPVRTQRPRRPSAPLLPMSPPPRHPGRGRRVPAAPGRLPRGDRPDRPQCRRRGPRRRDRPRVRPRTGGHRRARHRLRARAPGAPGPGPRVPAGRADGGGGRHLPRGGADAAALAGAGAPGDPARGHQRGGLLAGDPGPRGGDPHRTRDHRAPGPPPRHRQPEAARRRTPPGQPRGPGRLGPVLTRGAGAE